MKNLKRKLDGLDSIKMTGEFLKGDFQIQEYALCRSNAGGGSDTKDRKLPNLKSCLSNSDASEHFVKWLKDSVKTYMEVFFEDLLAGDVPHLDYLHHVFFRPPNAVCASSKVVLCADSVRMHVEVSKDDEEGHSLILSFLGVSQVITTVVPSVSRCSDLQSVSEGSENTEDDDDISAKSAV